MRHKEFDVTSWNKFGKLMKTEMLIGWKWLNMIINDWTIWKKSQRILLWQKTQWIHEFDTTSAPEPPTHPVSWCANQTKPHQRRNPNTPWDDTMPNAWDMKRYSKRIEKIFEKIWKDMKRYEKIWKGCRMLQDVASRPSRQSKNEKQLEVFAQWLQPGPRRTAVFRVQLRLVLLMALHSLQVPFQKRYPLVN